MTDATRFREIIAVGARHLGITVDDRSLDAFERLMLLVGDWNTRMNLTAVRDPLDFAVKHIIDSLTCLTVTPFAENAAVLDIGTGAGFPGLVLKIARPDLDVTLLDSTRKKLLFVDAAIAHFGWTGARTLAARAEEAGNRAEHRERYDIVTARAVAPMRLLSEFALPFVRVGGCFLAMKGPNVVDELPNALSAIEALGGECLPLVPFALPLDGGSRAIVPIRKIRPTPPGLPRIFRDIKRRPL
jgi:16S rRNA (guanine527-N7)-methyltransferase